MKIYRVVSGGQTGVDLAALDVAIEYGLDFGGWVPKGRMNEAGVIPATYTGLLEADSEDPAERTELNVRDSDATLILAGSEPSGGTLYTMEMAMMYDRPCRYVDLHNSPLKHSVEDTRKWLKSFSKELIVNVAGPRASEDPLIYEKARRFLMKLMRNVLH